MLVLAITMTINMTIIIATVITMGMIIVITTAMTIAIIITITIFIARTITKAKTEYQTNSQSLSLNPLD